MKQSPIKGIFLIISLFSTLIYKYKNQISATYTTGQATIFYFPLLNSALSIFLS